LDALAPSRKAVREEHFDRFRWRDPTCRMVKQPPKPQSPPPPTSLWDIYRVANKARLIGTVEADNAGEAIRKAAEQFKTAAWRLLAVQRR